MWSHRLGVHARRLFGACTKGGSLAIWAISRKFLSPFCKVIDRVISSLVSKESQSVINQGCVLICSPPRSGSTVLYQVVSRVIDCSYVTNLHQVFPMTASVILNNLKAIFGRPKGLKSYYGHTREWRNVNEGNELVDYWFKTNDRDAIRKRFIQTLNWLSGNSERAVIIKNVCVYDRLLELHSAVPEIIFVHLSRDTQQVIESELRGYFELGYFNPIPEELIETTVVDPVSFAVRQISYIERRITRQLRQVPDVNVVHWSYEEFCESPADYIEYLAMRLDANVEWANFDEKLIASDSRKVSQGDASRIREMLEMGVILDN